MQTTHDFREIGLYGEDWPRQSSFLTHAGLRSTSTMTLDRCEPKLCAVSMLCVQR